MCTANLNLSGMSSINDIVSNYHDIFQWKSTIKESPTHNLVIIECSSLKNWDFWECDATISLSHFDTDISLSVDTINNKFKFTNYTPWFVAFQLKKEDAPYQARYKLNFDVKAIRKYESIGLFDKEVEHISDVKLIVEGQELYACKKILAQYSSKFYEHFYENQINTAKNTFKIYGPTCNTFRVFLAMLYNQEVALTMNIFKPIADLAFHFQAENCLEELEKFLITEPTTDDLQRLKIGQKYNFKKLNAYILQKYTNVQELVDIGQNEGYGFNDTVKKAIYDRIMELNILAQSSSKFYDHFYENQANIAKNTFKIYGPTCNTFRVFLAMVYNQEVALTMQLFKPIADLAFHFKAENCLEQLEKFLIMETTTDDLQKLKIGQKYNFEKLNAYILQKYTNVQELVDIGQNESYGFNKTVKKAIRDRIVELNSGEKFQKNILLTSDKTTNMAEDIPFKVTFSTSRRALKAQIHCNWYDLQNPWKMHIKCTVLGQQARKAQVVEFSSEKSEYTYKCCMKQAKISHPIHLSICYKGMVGFFKQRSTNFYEPRSNLTDMVLSVGDKKFFVSKQILAYQSSYFDTIFFTEKNQTEIELKGIDSDEFEEFLQHIYHPNRYITDNNIMGLMRLSEKFDVPRIFTKCKNIVYMDDKLGLVTKIRIANAYDFTDLFEEVMSKISTPMEFSQFSKLDGFPNLCPDLLKKIVMRVFKKN